MGRVVGQVLVGHGVTELHRHEMEVLPSRHRCDVVVNVAARLPRMGGTVLVEIDNDGKCLAIGGARVVVLGGQHVEHEARGGAPAGRLQPIARTPLDVGVDAAVIRRRHGRGAEQPLLRQIDPHRSGGRVVYPPFGIRVSDVAGFLVRRRRQAVHLCKGRRANSMRMSTPVRYGESTFA